MYCFEANNCNNFECPVRAKLLPHCWEYFAQKKAEDPNFDWSPSVCQKCNYKLGWEIGLISDKLFPTNQDYPIDQLIPEIEKQPQTECSNKRFCFEITNCKEENCPVKKNKIIKCFNYFNKTENQKSKQQYCKNNCKICFYKKGWDIGLITEDTFKDVIDLKKKTFSQNHKYEKNLIVQIYMSELAKKPLSHKEEIELAKKIAGDKKASELFLLANLNLVTQIAKKYSSKLPLMDLIQEGNIGLIKAISKFDFRLGNKFSTYASYWIKYYMQKAVAEQTTSISIPCHLIVIANKIKLQIRKIEEQLSRPPTLNELSEILNISEEKIINILNVTKTPISLQTSLSEENDDETIEYYLQDKNTLTPEEEYFEKNKRLALSQALLTLNERQKSIIEKYYGLNEEETSLAEIGRQMNLSRERIRQILQQALLKLQQHESIIALKEY